MSKFYVATGLERAAEADLVADTLIKAGHEQTYRWTTHGSVQDTPDVWSQVALHECLGVMKADVVIVLLPGGRVTYTELGIAIGAGVPVVLVGDQVDQTGRTCVFYHLSSRVYRIPEFDLAAIAAVVEEMS